MSGSPSHSNPDSNPDPIDDALSSGAPLVPSDPPERRRLWVLIGVVVVTLIGCVVALSTGHIDASTIQNTVESTGWQGRVTYIGVALLLELLWLPRSWTIVAGAALFGLVDGILMSLVSDTLSALICYWLARHTGRDWAMRLISKRPRARQITRLLASERGGLTIGVLRCVPLAHYTLTSYAAGLASIRPRSFIIGNTLGLIPGAIVYGVAGGSVLNPSSPMFIVAIGLVVGAVVLSLVVGRILLKRLPPPDPLEPPGSPDSHGPGSPSA